MLQARDAQPPKDAAPVLAIDVRLTAISYAARDTNLYEFRRPDGGLLPAAEAGAHIDVHLPNGLVRQYSLLRADPAPGAYLIGVKLDRAGRGGSRAMHETLRVGQIVTIGAPRNNFPLAANVSQTVLFAGGIGITPIFCMVQQLEQQRRPWHLFYSCRAREDAALLEPLQKLGSRVTLHFDDEAQGRFLDLAALVAAQPADAEFYCCGPLPMLAAFEAATAARAREHVHVEYFTPKITAAAAPARGGSFIVELARSRKEFLVPPGKSILGILLDAGIDLSYSCEEGICGACETTVIAGTPNHCDSVLTDKEREENRTMMICCSGCKTERLVLDL